MSYYYNYCSHISLHRWYKVAEAALVLSSLGACCCYNQVIMIMMMIVIMIMT